MVWGEIRSRRLFALAVACASVALLASVAAAYAARPSGHTSASTGYDISYPQCGSTYPSGQAFGIVGVNGGLANDANSCLASELSWAMSSPGLTSPAQPAASLYINTADPGPAPGVTDWPTSGTDSYGTCDGSWSAACAYSYGQARGEYSYGLVVNATNANTAASATWWLDIETTNSWATSTTADYTGLNIATIHGFIAGLQSSGATGAIGVYSTASQWNQITGLTASSTPAAFGDAALPDWIAGTGSLKRAQTNCASGGFTGAAPTLAQYASGGYDADLRCG